MAIVKNVQLGISAGSTSSKKKVKVTYTLAFGAGDSGSYKLGIRLYGEDKQGDEEVKTIPALLYTYKFGSSPFSLKDYLSVPATAGEQTLSVEREISASALDEDPGFTEGPKPDINTPGIRHPHPDEVFAVASLRKEASSNTVSSGFGSF